MTPTLQAISQQLTKHKILNYPKPEHLQPHHLYATHHQQEYLLHHHQTTIYIHKWNKYPDHPNTPQWIPHQQHPIDDPQLINNIINTITQQQ